MIIGEAKEILEGVKVLDDSIYQYNTSCLEALNTALKALEEIQQYRSIGTIEELQKSVDVRKQVTEIVNRQLVAGKNNFKETYDCFHEIVKVVQDNY